MNLVPYMHILCVLCLFMFVRRHPPCPLCSRPAACPPPWGGRPVFPAWRWWTGAGRRNLRQCWWRASGPSRLWRSPPAPPWRRRQRGLRSGVKRSIPCMCMHSSVSSLWRRNNALCRYPCILKLVALGPKKKKKNQWRCTALRRQQIRSRQVCMQPQLFSSSFCDALEEPLHWLSIQSFIAHKFETLRKELSKSCQPTNHHNVWDTHKARRPMRRDRSELMGHSHCRLKREFHSKECVHPLRDVLFVPSNFSDLFTCWTGSWKSVCFQTSV